MATTCVTHDSLEVLQELRWNEGTVEEAHPLHVLLIEVDHRQWQGGGLSIQGSGVHDLAQFDSLTCPLHTCNVELSIHVDVSTNLQNLEIFTWHLPEDPEEVTLAM